MIHFQKFRITGVANATTFDSGLVSTGAEKKRLLSVLVQVSALKSNDIQGWHEREKVFDVPDELVETSEQMATAQRPMGYNRLNEIEVGKDLPIGETFKAAIMCGANNTDLVGMYRYEII